MSAVMLRALLFLAAACGAFAQPVDRLVFHGKTGPGAGKRIVLLSGDDEYRSEQALPQLAKILSERNGFETTVLFSIDAATGTIVPDKHDNIPGLETLDSADLVVMLLRFRDLPDCGVAHLHSRLRDEIESDVSALVIQQQGMGRRLRTSGIGRDMDQSPWQTQDSKHSRDVCARP